LGSCSCKPAPRGLPSSLVHLHGPLPPTKSEENTELRIVGEKKLQKEVDTFYSQWKEKTFYLVGKIRKISNPAFILVKRYQS